MVFHLNGKGRLVRGRVVALALSVVLTAAMLVPLVQAAPDTQDFEGVLRFGFVGVKSDPLAHGIQMAMDEINSTVGITAPDGSTYSLELVTLSLAPTADTIVASAEALVDAGVVVLFGPEQSTLFTEENRTALTALQVPILTGSTVDALTDQDADNWIFRIRAPERVYSAALATYLTTDLGFTSIALIQTNVESTEALVDFENTLTSAGVTPADKIQLPNGDTLDEQVERLININPEAVVMWGAPKDAGRLLAALRNSDWTGKFAYRHADQAAREELIPVEMAEGVLGADSWMYSYKGRLSRIFTRDYLVAFGEIPGPLSYTGYDMTWYLRAVMESQGVTPGAIQGGLIGGAPLTLVQGNIHPTDWGNGDVVRYAMVYALGPHGGPQVVALFEDGERLPLEDSGQEVAQAQTESPFTPTPGPPTETPFPTATFEGTWVRVTARTLNVRTGPGFNYDKVNEVSAGDTLRVVSAIADYSWLLIDINGAVGWIKTEYVELVSGDFVSIAVVMPPSSPTPASSPTPSLAPNPDLVIDSVVLNPAQPIPNQPFTATVNVRNAGGGAAGRFAIAATWQPNNVYTAAFVEGLAGGTSTQVNLTGTLTATGLFSVAVVADLNKEIAELNEDNNSFTISYRVDAPLLASQSGVQINAGTSFDLQGGTTDFVWDGYNLGMQNGAKVGVLGGTFENATSDQVTPGVANNATGLTTEQVNAGVVIAFITAENRPAVVRIDNRSGDQIWISYRVYNDTP